jgi:hypothetical protein
MRFGVLTTHGAALTLRAWLAKEAAIIEGAAQRLEHLKQILRLPQM